MRRLHQSSPRIESRGPATGRAPGPGAVAGPLLVGALAWVLGTAVAFADDARAWLARADTALATRNYVGTFVHEHAGESETLRVIHRVGSDGISERLQSLDGSGREFIRRGGQLTTYLPDQHTVLVEKSPDAELMFGGLPRIDENSANRYDVRELARTRVSGRDARVIDITPLDALRYGYRIWIDEATSMPLKTQLRDATGDVLEQIVFTDLRLPAHIADSELMPAVDARSYRRVQRDASADGVSEQPGAIWQAGALPPGFRMTANTRQVLPDGPVEHLVFSDGLASVSVFIDIGRAVQSDQARDDTAQLGPSSAYSTVVQGFRVTAVGEVPPDTVRAIAQAVRETPLTPATSGADGGLGLALAPAPQPLRGTDGPGLDGVAGNAEQRSRQEPRDFGADSGSVWQGQGQGQGQGRRGLAGAALGGTGVPGVAGPGIGGAAPGSGHHR